MSEVFSDPTNKELRRALSKFATRIEDYSSDKECWIWKGVTNWNKYGRFYFKYKLWYAHRWIYFAHYGLQHESSVIDHLCKNTLCVNPFHLEEVDRPTNILRGDMYASSKTHCKRGHEFTQQNTYIERRANGAFTRRCKICREWKK